MPPTYVGTDSGTVHPSNPLFLLAFPLAQSLRLGVFSRMLCTMLQAVVFAELFPVLAAFERDSPDHRARFAGL